jgi:hypothetical protein
MQPPTMLKIAHAPRLDAHKLPGYSQWLKFVLKRIGPQRVSRIDLGFHITHGLVDEVIYAAGGMERELMVLKEILSIAQQSCDAHNIASPKDTGVTRSVGLPAAHHASYTLVNAFTWARSVKDRAYRLLLSLKHSDLKTQIKTDYRKLQRRLETSVHAANYALHAGALHGPSTPAFQLRPNGTVYLQFPDAMNKPITTWNEHTYDAERDAVRVLQMQFDAVADFIDRMLDAFDNLAE